MERKYQSELTLEHYLEFQAHVCAALVKQPPVKKWHFGAIISLWLFLAGFILFALESYEYVGNQPSSALNNALILTIMSLIAGFVLNRKLQKSAMSGGASSTGTMLGSTTLVVSPLGVTEIGENHKCDFSWKSISEIIETPSLLVFLTDPVKGVMLPRASIPSNEYESLVKYGKEQIGNEF